MRVRNTSKTRGSHVCAVIAFFSFSRKEVREYFGAGVLRGGGGGPRRRVPLFAGRVQCSGWRRDSTLCSRFCRNSRTLTREGNRARIEARARTGLSLHAQTPQEWD